MVCNYRLDRNLPEEGTSIILGSYNVLTISPVFNSSPFVNNSSSVHVMVFIIFHQNVITCVFRWKPPSSLSAKAPATPATLTTTRKKKSGSLSQRNVERSLLNSRSSSGGEGWREIRCGATERRKRFPGWW